MLTSNIEPAQSNIGVHLDGQTKTGKGPLASPITSDAVSVNAAGHMPPNKPVTYNTFGPGTIPQLPPKPTLVPGSTVPNTSPYWSYSVPPPGLQQHIGSAVSTAPAFYPGLTTEGLNTAPLQWTTPVVPSHVKSVNSTQMPTTSMDTSDKQRGRSRKRCQRESSSSSDDSLDKESSRWRESIARDRSKSPQPPKMPVFTGSGNLSWEAFIYQFERTSNRRHWDDSKKLCRFLDCLSEVALEYARRSHISKYEDLRKYMKRRFSKKEEASAARRQLQYIRQGDEETIEEFAERVHFLTMDGYYRSNNDIIDQIGTEAFLRGCLEKDAARIVIEKNPRTINEALKWIKSSLANQKAIYGARRNYTGRTQLYAQRQVTFSDVNDPDRSPQRPTASPNSHRPEKTDSSLQSDIRSLVSLVGQLLKEGKNHRSPSPEVGRGHDSSYRCPQNNYARSPTPPRSPSHFRSPQLSRSPSPLRSQKPHKEQDNAPFKRTVSPSFQGTSSSNSTNDKTLNKSGSGQ